MRSSLDVEQALAADTESRDLEFKRSFDPAQASELLEVLKDVVAIANSGGGILVVGLDDNGSPCGADVSAALALDPATLGDKMFRYTDSHFDDFRLVACSKSGAALCAIVIGHSFLPLVFTRPGTYPIDTVRQKTAFSGGTVYFRHGAKSEPCTSEDLRLFVEDRIEQIRRSWLDGITRVVEAAPGSQVFVLPPEVRHASEGPATPIRLVDDPSAPGYVALPIDRTHPFRQMDVRDEINRRLDGRVHITSHHVFCARKAYSIDSDTRYCFTQKFAAPRYSRAFVEWLIKQYEADPTFFEAVKAHHDHPHGPGA